MPASTEVSTHLKDFVLQINEKQVLHGKFILVGYDPHQYTHINKNIQTTSTKCQYHDAASKPT